MIAALLGAVRVDMDRQVGWVKGEARRRARHAALIAVLFGVGALAVLGAIIVGLIALYWWLATETNPFSALGIMGGGLLLLALVLFALAMVSRRPPPASRPKLQIAQPAALFATLRPSAYEKGGGYNEQVPGTVANAVRRRSRTELLGTLALAAVVGLIVARRL
jgi:MFS family permease